MLAEASECSKWSGRSEGRWLILNNSFISVYDVHVVQGVEKRLASSFHPPDIGDGSPGCASLVSSRQLMCCAELRALQGG